MAPPKKSRKTAAAPLRKTMAPAVRKIAKASGGMNVVAVRKTVSVKKSTELLHIQKTPPKQNSKRNSGTVKKAKPKSKPAKTSGPVIAIAITTVNAK